MRGNQYELKIESCNAGERFLHALYGEEPEGIITLWTAPDKLSYSFPASETRLILDRADALTKSKDVYIHVALQKEAMPQDRRGSNESALGIPGFYYDLDIKGPGHKETALPETREDAYKLLRSFPLQPTLIVYSGGGLYPFWLFKEPWIFEDDAERQEAAALLKRFQGTLNAKAAAEFGWRIDNTKDLARVLRLPGTYNRKYVPAPLVEILEHHKDRRYNPTDFEQHLIDESEIPEQSTPSQSAEEQLRRLRERCKFIDSACEARGGIPEPLWYALVSNLAGIRPGGPDLCHQYSKGHQKYSFKETEAKIRHALNDTGPHTCNYIKRNGFDCGKTCTAKSPIALLRLKDGQPKEPPRPLVREVPPPEPYPIDALASLLGDAAQTIHEVIQAPLALCGQSILAGSSLAVQPYGNIHIDGREVPVSEYFISVAMSGERKSATDDAVLLEHRKFENELHVDYLREQASYLNAEAAYKKAKEEALKKAKGYAAKKEALAELGEPPSPPLHPVIIMQEPTFEGLFKAMLLSRPSAGIFNDEAGTFFGGHGMNEDNRLKAAAGYSSLWDGKSVSRVRGGDGVSVLRNRRLSMHLMAQPQVAKLFLNDAMLIDQGLLSRFLPTWPPSTAGTRMYKATDLSREPAMRRYYERMHTILRYPLPVSQTDEQQLVPPAMKLNPEAKALWVEFHDLVESQLADEAPLSPIRGFANKAPQHALRLAGILALVEGQQNINHVSMVNGIALTQYYMSETLRLLHASMSDPQLEQAQKLLDWAQKHEYVYLRQIYRLGPNSIRDAKVAKVAAAILEDHGWFERVQDGMELDGAYRRDVWRVVHV